MNNCFYTVFYLTRRAKFPHFNNKPISVNARFPKDDFIEQLFPDSFSRRTAIKIC